MKTNKIEKRVFEVKLEKRADADGNERRVIVGMPIVYESRSENFGTNDYPVYETIQRGAATKALEKSDARALYDHGGNGTLPLGRESSGTLQLRETPKGVEAVIFPPDTSFARDLEMSLERGDIREMSFAFYLAKNGDRWEKRDNAEWRVIREFEEILDVSIVPFAAYPETSVVLRSRDAWKEEIEAKHRTTRADEDRRLATDIFILET